MPFQQLLQNINWATPTWDLFILIFFVVAAFLYGLSLGRDRIIVILVSIYMALAVVNSAPFIGGLAAKEVSIVIGQVFAFRVTLFLGVFLILFLLLSRSALLGGVVSNQPGSWWQVILFSVLHIGLLISIVLSFLSGEIVGHLAPFTRIIFVSDLGKFFWIVTPILAMIFIGSGKKTNL